MLFNLYHFFLLIYCYESVLAVFELDESEGIFIVITFFYHHGIQLAVFREFVPYLCLQFGYLGLILAEKGTYTSRLVTNILEGLCLSSCSGDLRGEELEDIR